MKKLLIAAAMATVALSAAAQSTDTVIYGRMATYTDSTKTGTADAVKGLTNDSSRFGVSVTENLGGGLSARAMVETSIASDDPKTGASTQLGDRHSTVGLASNFGTVDLGRKKHAMYLAMEAADPFSVLYANTITDIHNKRDSRLGDGVFLATSAGGLGIAYDHGQTATGSNVKSYSLGYGLGPVRGTFARWEQGIEKTDLYTAVGKFDNTTLYYAHSKSEGALAATNSKGDTVSARQQIGKFALKASYGRTNTNVKAYSVGGEYNLSKRTDLVAAVRQVEGATAAADIKQYGLGIVHRF